MLQIFGGGIDVFPARGGLGGGTVGLCGNAGQRIFLPVGVKKLLKLRRNEKKCVSLCRHNNNTK